MSNDQEGQSRWGDNALTRISNQERMEKIDEHNSLVRKYNRLLEKIEKKKANIEVEEEIDFDETKKLFRETVTTCRDRRLVLCILIMFERKSYHEWKLDMDLVPIL